ncbi:hypothetical protein [Klebsiella oxytoca]|uniref:hypothetical protein n=1 Tax=Klebsiella oxytoca TaxID=571 RepID=UPI002245DC37|nr:hypothetical protein [Klebsiella oxytoca]MCW9635576.1 hypothetical protein [Klebsiella oxytoca]
MTSKLTRERLQEITLRLTRLDVLETILRNELGLPCESPIPDIAEKIYDMKRSRIYSVVPEEWTIADAVKFCRETGRQDAGAAMDAWNACRAAMLQAGYAVRDLSTPVDPQVAEYEQNVMQAGNSPVIPGAEQRIADAVELLKKAAPAMLADNSGPDGPLAGRMNSPVIPDGYVMVPEKAMTPKMIIAVQMNTELGSYAAANLVSAYRLFDEFWSEACRAAQQEVKGE